MPQVPTGATGVLRFGTAAITEPFSFVDGSRQVVGIDIEIAARVAQKLDRRLEVVDMEFGAMIPALIAGKVDMIGACITITDERAQKVLFSAPYYTGGIAALVKGGE
jgi:polar amino acid transport system substrate-binding protein